MLQMSPGVKVDEQWPLYRNHLTEKLPEFFDSLLTLDIYSVDDVDGIRAELLSDDRRPCENDPLFFIPYSEERGHLIIQAQDSDSNALICFTDPLRAHVYGRCISGDDCPISIHSISDEGFREAAESHFGLKVTHMMVDPHPMSRLNGTTSVDDFLQRGVIETWATYAAAAKITYNGLLGIARYHLLDCDFEKAKDACLATNLYAEPGDPEVHYVLGQCAVAGNDRNLVDEVQSGLERMGGDWSERFRSFREICEKQSVITALYEVDSTTTEAIRSLRRKRFTRMRGYTVPPIVHWNDELPFDFREFVHERGKLRDLFVRLCVIRQALWRNGTLPNDGVCLWNQAKQAFPDWPLFSRLEANGAALRALASNEAEAADGNTFFEDEGWKGTTVIDREGHIQTIYKKPRK